MTELTRSIDNLYSPEIFTDLAKEVQSFVNKNNLVSNIKGKMYVQVEGWQLTGNLLGLFPRLTSLDDIHTKEREYKYRASVDIIDRKTGTVISTGVAVCSNAEKTKQYFDEYAIASMAQTRAMGKAFRMCLGWLMKASGFEATPTEEMDNIGEQKEPLPYHIIDDFKKLTYLSLDNANSAKEIEDIMNIAKNTFSKDAALLDYARRKWKDLSDFNE